jgi:hypothetical protein
VRHEFHPHPQLDLHLDIAKSIPAFRNRFWIAEEEMKRFLNLVFNFRRNPLRLG